MLATKLILFAALFISTLNHGQSVKILGIFPFASYSHNVLGFRLLSELAEKGHSVTMLTPFAGNTAPKNFKTIVLTGFIEESKKHFEQRDMFSMHDAPQIVSIAMMTQFLYHITEQTLEHPNTKNLINSEAKFDVIIVEQFMSDALMGFCHHFNAPCIAFSSIGCSFWTNSLVGNPTNPAYIPELQSDEMPPFSFWTRFKNSFVNLFGELMYKLYVIPKHNSLMLAHFPNAPKLTDILRNTSLVLLNSNVVINQPIPHVPNMIEIGGLHIRPPKNLPKDLKQYMDTSKNGVLYFSMGSNLRSKDLPLHIRDTILKVFSKLTVNILWKFEDENIPNLPKNVKIQSWIPQEDLLGHPNVKAFITHGGLLSTSEAIYNGVPMIGIPIFGDQWVNIMKAKHLGFGIPLKFPYNITEDSLTWSINEILYNPKYAQRAKLLSQIFHDQPSKPMDSAVYWVEYVARYKGAKHLQSAAVHLLWWQYYLLDVIAVAALIAALFIFSIIFVLKKIFCRNKICSKAKDDSSKKRQ